MKEKCKGKINRWEISFLYEVVKSKLHLYNIRIVKGSLHVDL